MTSDERRLAALAIPGLSPDSLGNYLASLGLLRALTHRWLNVRAAWRNGTFHVVGGPVDLDGLLDALSDVASKRNWTPYDRGWSDAQKKSTRAKSGAPLALWQGSADERDLELLTAHVVPVARVSFNPLLGSGGNAGKRDFAKGWKAATDALAPSDVVKRKKKTAKSAASKTSNENERQEKRNHLQSLLLGEPVAWLLEKLNAASWFSEANKLYNSGQRPFRDGGVSPWAMALACEGLIFFAGGASRRLGARARAVGAFPFVTRGAAPQNGSEAGRDLAEVWAPLWDRPMTVREVQALFARGRAEIRGRGALTPSAFATAIVGRGIDAGITEFRRFILARTTSANTFEPRFEGAVIVRTGAHASQGAEGLSIAASATTLDHLLALVDRLPRDRKVGDRWRFLGLRGPLEAAMLDAATAPTDAGAACALVDAAAFVLDRVDRNRGFRERNIAWRALPLEWLPSLFEAAPCGEARLALALVSAFPKEYPFALYRFGVRFERGVFAHSEHPPARWVWRQGRLPSVLSDVVHRRTLDWEADKERGALIRSPLPAYGKHVEQWLAGLVDDELLSRWVSRLALFDWRFVPSSMRFLAPANNGSAEPSGAFCLLGLFQPLYDLRPVRQQGRAPADLLPRESGARTPAAARTLANLLRAGQVDAAIRFAMSRYAMAGVTPMRTAVPWDVADPERLLASSLFPISNHERAALVQRWLRPQRQGDHAHA